MDMLSGGPNNLESSVPSGGSSNTAGLPVAQKLREQLEDVETIKAERAVVESEIKGTKPDMKSVFSKALTQDGVISEEQISLESLGRSFGPLKQQVMINVLDINILDEKIDFMSLAGRTKILFHILVPRQYQASRCSND